MITPSPTKPRRRHARSVATRTTVTLTPEDIQRLGDFRRAAQLLKVRPLSLPRIFSLALAQLHEELMQSPGWVLRHNA